MKKIIASSLLMGLLFSGGVFADESCKSTLSYKTVNGFLVVDPEVEICPQGTVSVTVDKTAYRFEIYLQVQGVGNNENFEAAFSQGIGDPRQGTASQNRFYAIGSTGSDATMEYTVIMQNISEEPIKALKLTVSSD